MYIVKPPHSDTFLEVLALHVNNQYLHDTLIGHSITETYELHTKFKSKHTMLTFKMSIRRRRHTFDDRRKNQHVCHKDPVRGTLALFHINPIPKTTRPKKNILPLHPACTPILNDS